MEVGLKGCLDMLMFCACCLFICILKHTHSHTHTVTFVRIHTHTSNCIPVFCWIWFWQISATINYQSIDICSFNCASDWPSSTQLIWCCALLQRTIVISFIIRLSCLISGAKLPHKVVWAELSLGLSCLAFKSSTMTVLTFWLESKALFTCSPLPQWHEPVKSISTFNFQQGVTCLCFNYCPINDLVFEWQFWKHFGLSFLFCFYNTVIHLYLENYYKML